MMMSCNKMLAGLPLLWLFTTVVTSSTPPPPDVAGSCESSDAARCPAAHEADDSGFFQLRRRVAGSEPVGEYTEKWESAALKAATPAEAADALSKQFMESTSYTPPVNGGEGITLNWWNLPVQRSEEQLAQCTAQLKNKFGLGGLQFGYIPGRDGPRLAYECTNVPGLSDKMPDELRGVFWMKGNLINEELVVLQNGQWFPESRKLITPLSPFSWAWTGIDGTAPKHPPFFGYFYRNEHIARGPMLQLVANQTAYSIEFSECPGAPWMPPPFGLPGHACAKGSGNPPEMTYARLLPAFWGQLKDPKGQFGEYTTELFPNTEGNSWYRGIYFNVMGLPLSFFSYNLLRIIDGDGKPVEPYYSEYLDYIGDANLAFWYNYTSPEVLPLLKKEKLRDAWQLMWGEYCREHPDGGFC